MYEKLNKKIRTKLENILQTNLDNIFKNTDYCHIFGGAIRDVIADIEINDIDILCCTGSYKELTKNLLELGFVFYDKISQKDVMTMYSNLHIIHEPTTYCKYINGKLLLVQLIKPSLDSRYTKEAYTKSLGYVDINICGVAYNLRDGLIETVEDSIYFIKNKVFLVDKKAKMYQPTRIYQRVNKMENKGFKNVTISDDINDFFDLNATTIKTPPVEKFYKDYERYKKLKKVFLQN